MILTQLLTDHMGARGESINSLSLKIGIRPDTLRKILDGGTMLNAATIAKLIYWLLSDNNGDTPIVAPVTPLPQIARPVAHRTPGKVVTLSPRMQALVNQKGNHHA